MKGVERQLGRGGVRAGVTLVELLIALALMVAVAGLALPNMFSILARSTAEEGRRQALAALASARAEAIGAGEPVRVMAEPVGGGGADGDRASRGWRLRAVALEPEGEPGAGGQSAWLDDEDRWRPETVAALPAGWIVLASEAGGAIGGPMGGPEAVEPVELVTFLPDGGAIAPLSPVRFGAGDQRFALKVDRWSGRATLAIDRGEIDDADIEAGEMDRAASGDDEFGAGEFEEDPQW